MVIHLEKTERWRIYKMKTFRNNVGCIASFDDDISPQEIAERLSFFGGEDWREVKDL